jgi:phosphatidylserine decarboxylase
VRIPLAADGLPFILPPLLFTVLAAFEAWWPWAALFFLITLFLVSFFRDPERHSSAPDNAVLSPADGTILSVSDAPPGEAPPDLPRKIVIFMSVFNCHVNRAPISGKIESYSYSPGRKLAAFSPKASTDNEQNTVELASGNRRLVFKQIAGALARRIVFRPRPGDLLTRGQRVGMIRFGSRVDLFLPPDANPTVKKGDKIKAGVSVLAELAGNS